MPVLLPVPFKVDARVILASFLLLVLLAAPQASAQGGAAGCAPFSQNCVMPFPNDQALTVRAQTPTGVRVKLPRRGLPATKDGVRANPAEWNRNDGFSPGQQIIVRVPGLSSARGVSRSNLPTLDDIGSYTERDSGLLVLDARTGRRHPVWAEVDVNPPRAADRMLLIHPARNFTEGRRYVVVLRNLRTASGRRIAAPRGTRVERAIDDVASTLRRARVRRDSVHLAWDFTVASERSLQSRMLAIRDDAFAQLGDRNLADGRVEGNAPAFQITNVASYPADDRIQSRVTGTFTVPCYLQGNGCPSGSTFNYASRSPDATPVQKPGNTMQAKLECIIPKRALTQPARIAMYGHGLLGDPNQVEEQNVRDMAVEHGYVFCGTPWYGFASEDVPFLIRVLQNVGLFPAAADRIQQGFLAQLVLGRLMLHPQGLASHPAFQSNGRPMLDLSELFFDGNSQGGIYGAALAAMAPDFRKAVLGVPAMNYSVLLYRSVDFDLYSRILAPAYPRWPDRIIGLSFIQMLWDRAEPNGWAAHVAKDPPPNTPTHQVLLHPAVGDHQVTTWQADALARTIGASARKPAIAANRTAEKEPLWGIPAIPRFPFTGSAIVYWDPGPGFVPPSPVEDKPNRGGTDSHNAARNSVEARRQKAEFLKPGGAIIDVCAPGVPCPGSTDPSA